MTADTSNTETAPVIPADHAKAIGEAGIAASKLSFGLTQMLLAGFEGDAWVASSHEGGNHTLWTVGHLAVSAAGFAKMAGLLTHDLPEDYDAMFNMGSVVKPAMSDYPSPDVVTGHYNAATEHLQASWANADPEKMAVPLEGYFGKFFPAQAHMMLFASQHEMSHAGQIMLIRRMLGMPRVLG